MTTQESIADRLRKVREKNGIPNVRMFWRRLTDGSDYEISYDAVRTYDAGREPPPSFLARVADVFGVPLEWLITGRGHIDQEAAAEEEARQEAGKAARGAALSDEKSAAWFQWLILGALIGDKGAARSFRIAAMEGWPEDRSAYIQPWVPSLMEARRRLGLKTTDPQKIGRAMRCLLLELNVDPVQGVDPETYRTQGWLDQYITAMVPVLSGLAPERERQRTAESNGSTEA